MTEQINGLPLFEALVTDEETGMFRISLVDLPAVESNFLAFGEVKKMQRFAVQDEEQRRVLGVVMRADFPLYRVDAEMGEFYVVYSADTIKKMAEKYLKDGRANAVNLMHEDGTDLNSVDMVQFFIKDTKGGVSPVGFEDIEDGSLFAEFHVLNDALWQAIKEGTFRGFSLEGLFTVRPVPAEKKEETHFSHIINPFTMPLKKFKTKLARILAEFGVLTTEEGVLYYDADELAVGVDVYTETEDGERTPAPDGDYHVEGKTVKVAEGKVAEIVEPEAEPAAEAPAEEEVEAKKKKACCEDETPAAETPAEEAAAEVAEEVAEEVATEVAEEAAATLEDRVAALEETVAALTEALASKFRSAGKPAHENFKNEKPAATTEKVGFFASHLFK